jgi:hypothetical protein
LLNAGMAFYLQQFYPLQLEFFQLTECHDLRNSLAVILPLYMQLTLAIEPTLTHFPNTHRDIATTTGCCLSSFLRILKYIDEDYKIFVHDYGVTRLSNDKLCSPNTSR